MKAGYDQAGFRLFHFMNQVYLFIILYLTILTSDSFHHYNMGIIKIKCNCYLNIENLPRKKTHTTQQALKNQKPRL